MSRLIDRLSKEQLEIELDKARKQYDRFDQHLIKTHKRIKNHKEKLAKLESNVPVFERTMRTLSASICAYEDKLKEIKNEEQ